MNILVYPHKILKQKARPVENIDGKLQKLIDQMLDTMYLAKGIGLAANQVGVLKQLFVMDITPSGETPEPVTVINPRIIDSYGEEVQDEGCLSVPSYSASIRRPAGVMLEGYDRDGKPIRMEAEGLMARCIQHELDHLYGICFVDRLSSLKKAIFRRKWAKIRQQNG
ncbi:MAG TPA: peptide deformylase [Thermodesulfobacteriaceae bacterium]|nr:peptide deformylase [Thermodesulfobacteriaceae bacterium]